MLNLLLKLYSELIEIDSVGPGFATRLLCFASPSVAFPMNSSSLSGASFVTENSR